MNKLIPFALVAVLGSAGLASAENSFSLPEVQSRTNEITLGAITTDGPGVVQIFEYNDGKMGPLLGSHDLLAGANENVKVSLDGNPLSEAIAVLVVDGKVVATQPVRFDDMHMTNQN